MNSLRRCISLRPKLIQYVTRCHTTNLYEPDYLEAMKSKVPLYDTLNVQLRGYDYPVLESYQKFLHTMAKNMDIDVEDCWATPAQELQISTYKPQSEIVANTYLLKKYERTVQITDISAFQLQVFLRTIEASTPEGVSVQVVPHEEYHEDIRYIPDQELNTLKQQLEELQTSKKK